MSRVWEPGMRNVSARPDVGWREQDINESDATWILTSAFLIFTMQSGVCIGESAIEATDIGIAMDDQTDGMWILSSSFIIFTMQSGFGLLESGSVSVKNELNIMVKNAVDVVFGGLAYWAFGYGLSFGEDALNNPIFGWGSFCVNANDDKLGWIYSKFFFQASFATTATTIVSGAMAERTKLTSYMVFSIINTVLFSLPAHWVWASSGWLYNIGIVDIAGAGPVHLVGGLTGLVATIILKPRYRRYTKKKMPQMSSPTNAVLGMFMLWWGWLGFNCGSTFGISGNKWKLAARSAASTLSSSVSGGVAGFVLSYIVKSRTFDVTYLINGLLGSLVSITASCALVNPWEGIVIGLVGSILTNGCVALLDKLKIDDPVGCVGTHAVSGAWGLLAAGLFIRDDSLLDALYLTNVKPGLFYGGGFRQLGVQALGVVAMAGWSIIISFVILKIIDCVFGLRVSLMEEIIGADIVEHGIGNIVYDSKTKRIVHQDGEDEHEIQTSDDLAAVHEREIRAMRDRSLSQFSHLLGHSTRRRTLAEINSEINHERYRSFGETNQDTDTNSPTQTCTCTAQQRNINRSDSVRSSHKRARFRGQSGGEEHRHVGRSNSCRSSQKRSRFHNIWRSLRLPRNTQVDNLRHERIRNHNTNHGRQIHDMRGAVSDNVQPPNGHATLSSHDLYSIDTDNESLSKELTDISEAGDTFEDANDVVIQLMDELPTVTQKTSALMNIEQISNKTEMTHI